MSSRVPFVPEPDLHDTPVVPKWRWEHQRRGGYWLISPTDGPVLYTARGNSLADGRPRIERILNAHDALERVAHWAERSKYIWDDDGIDAFPELRELRAALAALALTRGGDA